jgi:hypothetical protein
MMTSCFIYRPVNRDRVFAAVSGANGPLIVTWANGCRHVLGGAHLSYTASLPRQYWRDEARAVATAIVEALGAAGQSAIAWDDRGTIHLVVPVAAAWRAHGLMEATRGEVAPASRPEEQVGLLLAGVAGLEGLGLTLAPRGCVEPTAGLTWTARRFGGEHWIITTSNGHIAVRAPAAWGPPESADSRLAIVGEPTTTAVAC